MDYWNKKNGILLGFATWAFEQGCCDGDPDGNLYDVESFRDFNKFEFDTVFTGAQAKAALEAEGYYEPKSDIISYGRLLSHSNFSQYMDEDDLWK